MNYYRNINKKVIMQLILDDNTKIDITENDFPYIFNTVANTAQIQLSEHTFTKSDVKGIEFLPSWNLDYIPDYFCHQFTYLNNEFEIPSTVTKIGNNFLQQCENFNSLIIFPNKLLSIGKQFMYDCYIFNQPMDSLNIISNSVGPYFMDYCHAFNKPIDLTNWTFDILSHNFMSNCIAFDQILNLNNFKEIQYSFLSKCYMYTSPITIPSNITLVDASYFIFHSYNFTGPLYINTDPDNFQFITSKSDTLLSTNNSSYPMYKTGVSIKGTYATQFKNKFSKNPESGYYRKLV